MYAYCFVFYFTRSSMRGFLQTSFFFGWMLVICYGFFVMLGAVGFTAAMLFVKKIYQVTRRDAGVQKVEDCEGVERESVARCSASFVLSSAPSAFLSVVGRQDGLNENQTRAPAQCLRWRQWTRPPSILPARRRLRAMPFLLFDTAFYARFASRVSVLLPLSASLGWRSFCDEGSIGPRQCRILDHKRPTPTKAHYITAHNLGVGKS